MLCASGFRSKTALLQASCVATQGRVCTAAATPNILQKLGRVLKEKATGDLDRVFQGTSKTREKLGVRILCLQDLRNGGTVRQQTTVASLVRQGGFLDADTLAAVASCCTVAAPVAAVMEGVRHIHCRWWRSCSRIGTWTQRTMRAKSWRRPSS